MSNPTAEKRLTDRGLIKEVLKAQADLAKVLFLMNINQNSREAAADTHTRLTELFKAVGISYE